MKSKTKPYLYASRGLHENDGVGYCDCKASVRTPRFFAPRLRAAIFAELFRCSTFVLSEGETRVLHDAPCNCQLDALIGRFCDNCKISVGNEVMSPSAGYVIGVGKWTGIHLCGGGDKVHVIEHPLACSDECEDRLLATWPRTDASDIRTIRTMEWGEDFRDEDVRPKRPKRPKLGGE